MVQRPGGDEVSDTPHATDVVRPTYRRRIVVKFLEIDRLDDARAQLEEVFGPLNMAPLFTAVSREQVNGLVERAQSRRPGYVAVNFLTYFTVDTIPTLDSATFARRVAELDTVVSDAYPDVAGIDATSVDFESNPFWPEQTYLRGPPTGINALAAWSTAGGDGSRQRLFDVEQGWTFDHEDVTRPSATLEYGRVVPASREHGTAVLGIVCAQDNNVGMVGIAPELSELFVGSHSGSVSNVADVIMMAAAARLHCGDVLLLEAQTGESCDYPVGAPVETMDVVFKVIELVTTSGIIVVEAVGNGPHLLDDVRDKDDNPIFDPAYRDSGAIMVAAATANVPHRRHLGCFGTRIDCYAWGENVFATWSTDWGATDLYTGYFDGTSAAAAIIAGAAVVVQGVFEAETGGRMSADHMRSLVSDGGLGTASEDPSSDLIGVMPDLGLVIESVLQSPPPVC